MILTTGEIERVHSISWAQPVGLPINCWVKFNHLRNEVPFTASPVDTEEHGRALYQRLISGEFGPIQSYGAFDYSSYATMSPRQIELSPKTSSLILHSIEEANLENSRGTPRGIILVWSALLEICLQRLLDARMPSRSHPPTLGGKISLLKNEGILADIELLDDLDAIKCIRNMAAHALEFSCFEHLRHEEKVFKAYSHLYKGYAAQEFLEVCDLLFVARFVVSPACMGSIERVMRLS